MKRTFCFVCGKENGELTEGLCAECYKKQLKVPKKKIVKYLECKKCGSTKVGKLWSKREIGEGFERIGFGTCPDCARASGGYYEAIIQVRGENQDSVIKLVEREITTSDMPRPFFRFAKVKGGYNFYIGNKAIVNSLASKAKNEFHAELKKTYKLFSKKDGKDICRTTLLIRC